MLQQSFREFRNMRFEAGLSARWPLDCYTPLSESDHTRKVDMCEGKLVILIRVVIQPIDNYGCLQGRL
jgi:hypothetical protein